MRRALYAFLFAGVAISATTASAAPFQNLDFEAWPGQAPMPGWELVMQEYDGTVLYQSAADNPIDPYPFYGYHIGDGPVIGINGSSSLPQIPNMMQGQYSLRLIGHPQYQVFPTRQQAEAALQNSRLGGIAQTAVVPTNAKSVWIATLNAPPQMLFNNFPVTLGQATSNEAIAMLLQESLDPTFLINNSSIMFYAGNIESIANRTRELKLLPHAFVSVIGAEPAPVFGYEVYGGDTTFDMIVFSSLPWDGPAVNVPEPAASILLLPAIAVLRRRRHHA